MTLSTSCIAVIVSEQFRHSMKIISIICGMTTSSSYSIQQQYDMSQLWRYDTFPDTDTNVSVCALLYVCEGRAPISACFVVTSISLSQREYHSKSHALNVCVCVCLFQSATHTKKANGRTHRQSTVQAVSVRSVIAALQNKAILKYKSCCSQVVLVIIVLSRHAYQVFSTPGIKSTYVTTYLLCVIS